MDKQTQAIIPLTSTRCLALPLAGAKAARLAAMQQAGFPVPEGFVVGTAALQAFLRHNGLDDSLWRAAPQEASAAVMAATMPKALQAHITAAAEGLGTRRLAVRSSAAAEDQQGGSMAGQFDTFLNTTPADAADCVRRCWASLFNAAPRAYRRTMAAGQDPRMGVLVQRQVDACFAGVVFTIDPLQKSADYLVVEWVTGLGDQLVSGRVTPERLYVRRDQPQPPGHLPAGLAAAIEQACKWARRAEQHFGQPIDMEWAADAQGFYVLQARPVTALGADQTVVWTNVNMAENFPQPLTPMAWSLVERFYRNYMHAVLRYFGWRRRDLQRAGEVIDHLTGVQFGRIYYRLNNWYAVMEFFPCSRWLIRFLNHYIGQKIPFQAAPRKAHHRAVSAGRRWCTRITFWPRLLQLLLVTNRRMAVFERAFFKFRQGNPHDRLSAAQLVGRIRYWQRFVARHWQPPTMADVMVMLLPGLLDLLTRRWLEEDPEAVSVQLYRGLDLVSLQPSVLIWELAQAIKTRPELQQMLQAGRYTDLERRLPEEIRRLLDRFMVRFGDRCFHDCMIVAPTFVERHDLLWKLVAGYQDAQAVHPRSGLPEMQRQYRDYLNARLACLPRLPRLVYHGVVKAARQSVALRERGRLLQSLLFGRWRLLVMALGRQLQVKGILKQVDEVFYLHLDEIDKLLNGKFHCPETIDQLIAARKNALADCADQEPPSFFFLEPGEAARLPRPRSAAPQNDGVLVGTGVSNGKVTAAARVIRDPVQGPGLRRGEILVTRATDPGWTPLFSIAGGLVLERGGLLSHGAIVAREFGIPAVVGVENATQRIADDQQVALDGRRGTVRLL